MASSSEDADAPLLILKLSERAPPLVRDVFEEKGFREHEEGVDGEHHWHLHWKAGRFKPSEYEVASKLQRVNHFPKTTGITKKDCLLRNMRRMRGIHGPIYDFFPEAYLLPTEYMTMVRVCKELAGRGVKPIWILKPTDASQGRKIFLIRDLAEISYGHFSSSIAAAAADLRGEGGGDDDADGGGGEERERAIATEIDMATTLRMLRSRLKKEVTPCVKFTELHLAQRYVAKPLTFHGYKLDLRIYVLLLSARPLRVYWYTDCLLRFATQKYDLDDLENAYSHLTNSSINKNSTSYGVDKEGIRAGCKWSLWRFTREHPDHPLGSPTLWARIKAIVTLTLLSIAADVPDNGGCFELLGYDVIVDAALKPWLLEVNTSPALGVECDADREVKAPLLSDLADLLALQRARAAAATTAGGGVAAAKAARGGSGERRGSGGGGGAGGASPAKAELIGPASKRARAATIEEVGSLPAKVGGYELIFPFNGATARLAADLGGHEAQAVAEVRAQLAAATAADPAAEPADDAAAPEAAARRRRRSGGRAARRGRRCGGSVAAPSTAGRRRRARARRHASAASAAARGWRARRCPPPPPSPRR